jgi:chemotaxis family two-component system sensor histidine kinase/response regulator PixL
MAVPPDIRDHAYKLFTEEVPDLLQAIESDLLSLRQDRSLAKIHSLMRNAHSIKGGAASVELDEIATVAHRLETIFKALYSDSLEIDADLERQLLQAYDCLRVPLMQQVTTGAFDSAQAVYSSEFVFGQIEEKLGDILQQIDNFDIPTSAQLGVDMALTILEVDVAEQLERLSTAIATSTVEQLEQELRSQIGVYTELAEILNKPGLGAIAEAVRQAIAEPSAPIMQIAQEALANLQTYREMLLNSSGKYETQPSAALLSFQAKPFNASREEVAASAAVGIGIDVDIDTSIDVDISADVDVDTNVDTDIDTDIEIDINSKLNDEDDANLIFEIDFDPFPSDSTFSTLIAALEEVQSQAEDPLLDVEADIAPATRLIHPVIDSPIIDSPIIDSPIIDSPIIDSPIVEIFTAEPSLPFPQFAQSAQPVSAQIHSEHISVTPVTTTTRVDSDRLEQINNLVDESIIQRSSSALDTDQIQKSVQEVLNRFTAIDRVVTQLRKVADRTLISSAQPSNYLPGGELQHSQSDLESQETAAPSSQSSSFQSSSVQSNAPQLNFDSLEMDNYGALHLLLQRFQEEMIQLREQVDDIDLFTKRSNKNLTTLRKTLNHLQDDFTRIRMLPIGEVLNRFPRLLRDLSNTYQKSVELRLYGTEVLVDKAIIERIADPLVHLVRNAFDHGIEAPEMRRQRGKPEQGLIEIKVFQQGRQTIIELKDDGAGLNLERITQRAVASGMLSPQDVDSVPSEQLLNLIFEPGFSTATRLSELSGRGTGLDVVRTQLRALKGTIAVTSQPGKGTTFTLCLPSTLTSDTLLICSAGVTTLAFSFDSIKEIFVPRADQVIKINEQWFLQWRKEVLPIYRLSEMLEYEGSIPNLPSLSLSTKTESLSLQKSQFDQAANPLLIIAWRQKFAALEIDQLITEQKLIIKPLGMTIAPPVCIYGCTVLSDGRIVPVIDGAALIDEALERISRRKGLPAVSLPSDGISLLKHQPSDVLTSFPHLDTDFVQLQVSSIPKILVVDDAVSLRQTLSFTLESAGYQVLQAGDGWEAVQQFQQNPDIALVISDIEMPNMNGFDLMHYRRQDSVFEKIPLIILSSRSNEKHKRLAMHLGATAYFTKPYIEQNFLQSIQAIMGK